MDVLINDYEKAMNMAAITLGLPVTQTNVQISCRDLILKIPPCITVSFPSL